MIVIRLGHVMVIVVGAHHVIVIGGTSRDRDQCASPGRDEGTLRERDQVTPRDHDQGVTYGGSRDDVTGISRCRHGDQAR